MSRPLALSTCAAALCLCAALPAAVAAQSTPSLTEAWRLGGFANPESIHHDVANERIIVSNIAGFGPDTGADGFLSVIDLSGNMVTERWIEGLTDPKGIGSDGARLYIGDAPGIQVVDIGTGSLIETIAVEGARVLNDVTADADGAIYVTDTGTGGIVKLVGSTPEWLVAPGTLSRPNGIFWDDGTLYVGTFGEPDPDNAEAFLPGGLYRVDAVTGAVAPVESTAGTAMVDGIARLGDLLLYNDNPTGAVFAMDATGAVTSLGEMQPGAADHGIAGDKLVVPYMRAGELVAYRLQ